MAVTNIKAMQMLAPNFSSKFLERIPDITKANMENIGNVITSYPTMANEFVEVLTNQVVRTLFVNNTITNKLQILEKGEIPYGSSQEILAVDLIKGKDFTDRFGGSYEAEALRPEDINNVKVQYISMNSRLKYKQTISHEMLRQAFREESGVSNLANRLANKMVESYHYDKFLLEWKLIDTMPTNKVVCVKPVDASTGKAFTRKVKEVMLNMSFPSTEYNVAKLTTQSNPSNLVIIMDSFTRALLDVEVLASTFNMSMADFQSRILVIPYFKEIKRVCLIADMEKFQIYRNLYNVEVMKNGAGLFHNIFLHVWDTIQSNMFANCVELIAEELTTDVAPYQEIKVNDNGYTQSSTPNPSGTERKMPYDVIELDRKDSEGNVIAELIETEIELDTNGEIKTKKDKKISKKK